ncbi:hypothetical protein HK405_000530, partial [Cladochytrium tenue]
MFGEKNWALLRNCLESLAAFIVERPGVCKAKIFKYNRHILSRVEVTELLDMLVQRGVCRRRLYRSAPAFGNLFDAIRGPALTPS